MKKWENPKIQDLRIEKTEATQIPCKKCSQNLPIMRVIEVT